MKKFLFCFFSLAGCRAVLKKTLSCEDFNLCKAMSGMNLES